MLHCPSEVATESRRGGAISGLAFGGTVYPSPRPRLFGGRDVCGRGFASIVGLDRIRPRLTASSNAVLSISCRRAIADGPNPTDSQSYPS